MRAADVPMACCVIERAFASAHAEQMHRDRVFSDGVSSRACEIAPQFMADRRYRLFLLSMVASDVTNLSTLVRYRGAKYHVRAVQVEEGYLAFSVERA